MALYNWMVFALLIFEIVTFIVLVMPLPFTWRRSIFKFLSTSPLIAKLQYGLKILFIFVGVLFVDSVQRMTKIHNEGQAAREQGAGVGRDLRSETDWRSRKFLSERDMYMRGFTLFLSLILSRTFGLILDLIKAQEDLAVLKKQAASQTREKGFSSEVEKKYKQKIEDLQKELDTLGKRVDGPGADKKSS
ncbi:endoplasmic reticulum protein [Melampsora americana]|nr:endoplasmic reticulum protein [Melampsora americana]